MDTTCAEIATKRYVASEKWNHVWNEQVTKWKTYAATKGTTVEFEFWGSHYAGTIRLIQGSLGWHRLVSDLKKLKHATIHIPDTPYQRYPAQPHGD